MACYAFSVGFTGFAVLCALGTGFFLEKINQIIRKFGFLRIHSSDSPSKSKYPSILFKIKRILVKFRGLLWHSQLGGVLRGWVQVVQVVLLVHVRHLFGFGHFSHFSLPVSK